MALSLLHDDPPCVDLGSSSGLPFHCYWDYLSAIRTRS